MQLPDCVRTVWRAETLQHIFPKSLNKEAFSKRCFIFPKPCSAWVRSNCATRAARHAVYYASIWQWFDSVFFPTFCKNQVTWGTLSIIQLFLFQTLFLFYLLYSRPSTKCVHKVAVSTEFNFHLKKKKRCFRRRCRFLQKSASLFRGTFCFMRLTDIPLCIWLCLFRVSHWFKQKDTHWYHQQMHCVQRNRRMKRRLLYTIYFLFSFFLVTKGSNHCFILLFYKWFIVLWYNKKRESWR